ncbi:hypothetical protein N7541_001927 [Penicillium brevicompactum]|uniref:Uncharacterized protein n=1 Tax=Penicillium brevicompactum TaxID=5074 RepID=A0A9W9RIW7_PENBR|nr:hypothetical protein N7541_001927 [Penicillium brevicompactum]
MAPTELTSRPKLCHSSIEMWQRSKQDWIDRSTNAFQNSKNRAQKSTADAWNHSKSRAQQSTMQAWTSSKSRTQRVSMGAWNKSIDAWVNSKERCQESATSAMDRSVAKWNQSADQMHQAVRVQQSVNRRSTRPSQKKDNASPPSSPDSTKSTSRFYAQSNPSTPTSPVSKVEVPVAITKPVQPSSVVDSALSPKDQIGALHDAATATGSLVERTKRLRDDRNHVLGEIELEWVNSTIAEADSTSSDLSTFIEPFWAAQYNKDTTEGKSWSRRDIQRALKKESRMLDAHSKVETVFGHLESLPAELNISSTELKDVESPTSQGIAELPTTRVVFIAELPGDSPVESPCAGLPSSISIPTIVVTQYEGSDDDASPVRGRSPPPSYEASALPDVDETR